MKRPPVSLLRPDSAGATTRPTAQHVAITAAVAIVLHFPALIRKAVLNSDEATIGTIARVLRHGGTLYRDAVDRKPPGAFMVYRLLEPVFGDWTLMAGRWLTLALTVTAMWVLAIEARRRWPAVSPFAVALVGVAAFSLLPAEDSRAVGFELLATLPVVGAFVFGARRRVVLAGCCLGVAALFKQPMLLGALPLIVQCLTDTATSGPAGDSRTSWSRRVARLAAAGAATLVTVALGLAPFGFGDALTWFSGSGDNYLSGTELSTVMIVGLEQVGSVLGLTMGIILLGIVAWRRTAVTDALVRGRFVMPPLDIVVWLIAGLVASSIGLRFILHYFNQILPAMVLLAAPSLTGWSAFRPRLPRFALVWLAGGLAFSMWTLLAPAWFHDLPNVDRVAAAIDDLTEPSDMIFVWGQAPEIYWVSQRDPATRYPHIGFITGVTPKRPGVDAYVLSQPEAADNLLSDLQRERPALIVDAAIESVRGGDRYPLATSPIADFVAENYCEIAVIDGIRLLSPCTN